jgi:hypothetical protein
MGGMARSSPERRFARNVLVAWSAWAVSFILPAAAWRNFQVHDLKGDIVFSGWWAAAICLLHPSELVEKHRAFSGLFASLIRLMAITNVVMVGSLATLTTRRASVRRAFMFLAAGAACVDMLAPVLVGLEWLSYGYVVWVASFVMLALTLSRDPSASRPF